MFNAKVDENQPEIVAGLRSAGFFVALLHRLGEGWPDILVSNKFDMWLMEIKMPGKKLNKRQEKFHKSWGGKPIYVVHSLEEALAVCYGKL